MNVVVKRKILIGKNRINADIRLDEKYKKSGRCINFTVKSILENVTVWYAVNHIAELIQMILYIYLASLSLNRVHRYFVGHKYNLTIMSS